MPAAALDYVIFAVSLLGSLFLSSLLLTVVVSDKIYRHPVFTNLLCTYILYTFFMTFIGFAKVVSRHLPSAPFQASEPGAYILTTALEDSLKLMGLTSTFNFVIHLWFAMRGAFHNESVSTEKFRTTMLLITPYLMGVPTVAELLYQNPNHPQSVIKMVGYIELAVVIITSFWDVLLLFTFYNHRRIFRQANMRHVMTLSLLSRITLICLFRFIILAIGLVFKIFRSKGIEGRPIDLLTSLINTQEAVYPLVAGVLLSLQRDILHVWFPRWVSVTSLHVEPIPELELPERSAEDDRTAEDEPPDSDSVKPSILESAY